MSGYVALLEHKQGFSPEAFRRRWLRAYDEATRITLLRILDSLLILPEPLAEEFINTLEQEDPVTMHQLTSADRVLLRREKLPA